MEIYDVPIRIDNQVATWRVEASSQEEAARLVRKALFEGDGIFDEIDRVVWVLPERLK